ncbi:MAG: hypothetical protein RL095_2557 [Verrucomicrobiota bacterium]
MPVTSHNLFASGIDIGITEIYVCAIENSEQVVKNFGFFTCDLKRMVEWLKGLKVKTVPLGAQQSHARSRASHHFEFAAIWIRYLPRWRQALLRQVHALLRRVAVPLLEQPIL